MAPSSGWIMIVEDHAKALPLKERAEQPIVAFDGKRLRASPEPLLLRLQELVSQGAMVVVNGGDDADNVLAALRTGLDNCPAKRVRLEALAPLPREDWFAALGQMSAVLTHEARGGLNMLRLGLTALERRLNVEQEENRQANYRSARRHDLRLECALRGR